MSSGRSPGVGAIVRSQVLLATWLVLVPSASVAQYVAREAFPNELSLGLGTLVDQSPSRWSGAFSAALGWDWEENAWAVFVIEGNIDAFSEVERCRGPADDIPDNCLDVSVLAGLRFRPTPRAWSGHSFFGSVLLGEYWKGSGTDDGPEYVSGHFALQVGGGVEFRWTPSIQGIRVSLDYRRVFAGDRDRNQLRFLASYVIGPRRFKVRPAG